MTGPSSRTYGRLLSVAMAASVAAATGASAGGDIQTAGPVAVKSDPGLVPPFDHAIPDYAIHCDKHTPVKFTFDASGTTRVSVNGGAARSGHSTAKLTLTPGRALYFTVDSGADAGTYHVRCLPKNFPVYLAKRDGEPQAGWYVVTVGYIAHTRPDYTIIFDDHGVPVWWMRDSKGLPFNGSLLPDGNVAWYTYTGGVFGIDPRGGFKERSLDGRSVRTWKARGGPTDWHEFQVLPNHHVMLIRYKPRSHVDLRKYGGPSDATVVDGQIQEMNRHRKVVWTWNTKDHIPLSDAKHWFPQLGRPRLPDGRNAYDVAHLNSIDPHGKRIVISLRHTDAVYEIDKSSGRVLWKLGGRRTSNSLKIVGDPLGDRSFGGQHDARLSDDGRYLTVFDNGTNRSRPPRAVRYRIDAVNRTATLIESVTNPAVGHSDCCGGARRLPGGDWVIAWGVAPYVTETDATGNPVLTLDFRGRRAYGEERSTYRVFPVLPGRLDAAKLRTGMDAMAH